LPENHPAGIRLKSPDPADAPDTGKTRGEGPEGGVKIFSGGGLKEPPLGTGGINDSPSPAYYAVIPATVRYDKDLSPNARLLYGEISALCNKYGYCWAFNAYFARLYEISERTVINWINALRDKGYISVEFIYIPGKEGVHRRIIRLQSPKSPGAAPAGIENPPVPVPGPLSAPAESGSREPDPAPGSGDSGGENPEGGVKIFSGGEEIFIGGVKKSSPGVSFYIKNGNKVKVWKNHVILYNTRN
jgi:hypothetical protein